MVLLLKGFFFLLCKSYGRRWWFQTFLFLVQHSCCFVLEGKINFKSVLEQDHFLEYNLQHHSTSEYCLLMEILQIVFCLLTQCGHCHCGQCLSSGFAVKACFYLYAVPIKHICLCITSAKEVNFFTYVWLFVDWWFVSKIKLKWTPTKLGWRMNLSLE